jgi:hypothetical protein
MTSVPQMIEALQRILEEEACELARSTGFIQRQRAFSGADFAQTLIFGWLQEPEERLDGLTQIFGRRDVTITASGLCQRFSEQAADFLREILSRLVAVSIQVEAIDLPLLRQFKAVIIEDSSTISLPDALSEIWRGCGGAEAMSEAALKLFVQWDVLRGQVHGPQLCDARCNDHSSPFALEALPVGSLYLADLGFFGLKRLQQLSQGAQAGKRFFVSRLHARAGIYTHSGHRIELRGILPRQEGEAREMGVLLGREVKLPVRLIMIKVSEEVAEQRRARIRDAARKQCRPPSEELLYLANWTLIVTNVEARRLSISEVLVLLRLRWQIERLFRLWKEDGKVDEWRSRHRWRIFCEIYAKLCALIIQHWLIAEGCWHDPYRSIVKAARLVRREANRIMVALSEGGLSRTLHAIVRQMRSGCRTQRRTERPCTAQLLLEGLEWQLSLT